MMHLIPSDFIWQPFGFGHYQQMSGAALIETNTICQLAKRRLWLSQALYNYRKRSSLSVSLMSKLNQWHWRYSWRKADLHQGGRSGRVSLRQSHQTSWSYWFATLPIRFVPVQHHLCTPIKTQPHCQPSVQVQGRFSVGDLDFGRTDWTKHPINTKITAPTRERPRRTPVGQRVEVDRQVKDLLERGNYWTFK